MWTATPRPDLCEQLTTVYAERTALGDAYESAIAGNVEDAVARAHAVKERMLALVDELPPEAGLDELQRDLRDATEASAEVMGGAAEYLDDPDRYIRDPELLQVEGAIVLRSLDWVLALREPGDIVSRACPGLAAAPDPRSFAPPPTNAALGLPDVAGRFSLEPHLVRVDASMAAVLGSLGVDPDAVRKINVLVSAGEGGVHKMDVFDRVAADPAAVASAVGAMIVPKGTKPTTREVAGFVVAAFDDPADPRGTLQVAGRRERVIVFWDFRNADVRDILAAMP